jgi:hypothetical protein
MGIFSNVERNIYHPPFPLSTPPPPDAKVPETRSQIQIVAFVRLLFGFFFFVAFFCDSPAAIPLF